MKRWLKKALVALCGTTLALSASALVGCSSCADLLKNFGILESSTTENSESAGTSEEMNGTSDGTNACHNYGDPVVVQPTCTTRGSSTVTCTICGDSVVTVLLATGHSYVATEIVEATCTEQGYTEYTCSCGDAYVDVTADKLGHDTLNAVWTVVGEEQVDGCQWVQYEKAICATCEQPVTHEELIEKHEYTVEITEAANCSHVGVKTYTCDCGVNYTEDFKNENGHAWVEGDTNDGITTWTCANDCGNTKTSFSAKTEVAATIPANAIQEAKEIALQNATLELPQEVKDQLAGSVDLSVDTLDETAKEEATSNLSVEEKEKLANAPIFNFNMMQGDTAVTKFEKEITVTVPYVLEKGADPADIAVWYIDDEGKLTSIPATYSEVNGEGFATFTTDHFSYYTVVRLSPKERCALYGCEERVSIIAPTCEADGYTLTKCIRCNATSRSAFVKALGHDYAINTVTPSCTSKGYTTYTCTRSGCKHSYQTNWKDMLAHEYDEKVVAPTCTAKGYTLHTCKGCGDSYADTYVEAKGHNYDNGACTACGKSDPSFVGKDELNFYFNAIEGLLNANSYYLEVQDLEVDYVDIYYSVKGNKSIEFETSKLNLVIDNLQMDIALDDNGDIIGKGVVDVINDWVYQNGRTSREEVHMEAYIKDGMFYAVATGDSTDEIIGGKCVASLDAVLSEIGLTTEMLKDMVEGAGELEDLVAILEGIKNTPDSPLNKVIADVVEYVYTKTETVDGYHFEFNPNRLEDVYSVLTEKKVDEMVDLVLGEGSYQQICNYLMTSIDKNVGVVIDDLAAALDLCGVDIENIYNLINLMSGSEEFEVRDTIQQFSSMKVAHFLDNMFGLEAGTTDYKAMITEYSAQFKEMTAMELIVALVSSTGGNQGTVTPDSTYPTDKPEDVPVTDETGKPVKPIAKRATIVENNSMYLMLIKVVETLEKSSFSFDTDKTGEVLNYTINLVNLGDNSTLEEKLEEIEEEAMKYYEEEGGRFSGSTTYMNVSGKILFQPNGSFAGSYEYLATMGAEAQRIVDGFFQEVKAGKIENVSLYVDVLDGEMFLGFSDWGVKEEEKFEQEFGAMTEEEKEKLELEFGAMTEEEKEKLELEQEKAEAESWIETTYAGQKAWMKKCYGSLSMVDSPSPLITTNVDCLDWERYSVNGFYYSEIYFNIYKNANGEYIGVEIEGDYSASSYEVASFYYNSTTGKYSVGDKYNESMHNYELVEYKEAVGCEGQGYSKYVCTNCQDVEINYYSNGHDPHRKFELSKGSKTCEDGVDVVWVCLTCGEEMDREINCYNTHEVMEEKIVLAHATCGDIVVEGYRCACGEHNDIKEPSDHSPCKFDYVETWDVLVDPESGEYKPVDVYRCAVTACAYTYTREYYEEIVGCTQYHYVLYRFGVEEYEMEADAEYLVKQNSGTNHRNIEHTKTQDENGVWTIYEYCHACDTLINHYMIKYDEHNRTVYYKQLRKDRAAEEWEQAFNNSRGLQTYYCDLIAGEGWTREYTGCYYSEYDLNGYYMGSGEVHEWCHDGYPFSNSCTQYQYYGYYEYCLYCDEGEKGGEYASPNDHSYYYDEGLGMYVCDRCNMKNETGADDIIIEDLTGLLSDAYTVGYYNRNWRDYTVYLVVNYGEANEQYLDQVTCTDTVTYKNSGIITVNMWELNSAIKNLNLGGQKISVVIQYFDPESGEKDPATGKYEGSYIDCVVTFE